MIIYISKICLFCKIFFLFKEVDCNLLGIFWGIFFILFVIVVFCLLGGIDFFEEIFFVFLLIIVKLFIFREVFVDRLWLFLMICFVIDSVCVCMLVIELDFVGNLLLDFKLFLFRFFFRFVLWCVVSLEIFFVLVNIGLFVVVGVILLWVFLVMVDFVGVFCLFLLLLVKFESFFVIFGVGSGIGELYINSI